MRPAGVGSRHVVEATLETLPQAVVDPEVPGIRNTLFTAVEEIMKGIEVPLPDGHAFLDKDRIERRSARIRWWRSEAKTYGATALGADLTEHLLKCPCLRTRKTCSLPTSRHSSGITG